MTATILVIDDSEVIIKMITHNFEREGHRVVGAKNGPDGLEMATLYDPDVILLDVMMPEMDGYEVCRRLRQEEATGKTPIVMLTSMASIANMQAGFEAGADDYVTKPFEITELTLRINAILRRTMRDAPAVKTGRVISVFSLRGGCGCSSLAVNLTVGLSQMWATRSVLFDLALPVGVCDFMLALKPAYTLSDLAQKDTSEIDPALIEDTLFAHESGVRLMSGILEPHLAELVSDSLVSILIDQFRELAPYTVIDLAHNFSAPMLAALDKSDVIMMPITPDLNSVRLAASTLKVFDALGYERERIHIAVNWTFPKAGIAASKIESTIGHPISVVIPHVPSEWSEAINMGKPVITTTPNEVLAAMLQDLVWRLSDPEDKEKPPSRPTKMYQRTARRMNPTD